MPAEPADSLRWVQELRGLRQDLGRTRRMRMRWKVHSAHVLKTPLPWSVEDLREVDVLLYVDPPSKGDAPVLRVPVPGDTVFTGQGGLVEVAGIAAPGHAVALVLADRVVFCSGPARQARRSRRHRWPGTIAENR